MFWRIDNQLPKPCSSCICFLSPIRQAVNVDTIMERRIWLWITKINSRIRDSECGYKNAFRRPIETDKFLPRLNDNHMLMCNIVQLLHPLSPQLVHHVVANLSRLMTYNMRNDARVFKSVQMGSSWASTNVPHSCKLSSGWVCRNGMILLDGICGWNEGKSNSCGSGSQVCVTLTMSKSMRYIHAWCSFTH